MNYSIGFELADSQGRENVYVLFKWGRNIQVNNCVLKKLLGAFDHRSEIAAPVVLCRLHHSHTRFSIPNHKMFVAQRNVFVSFLSST